MLHNVNFMFKMTAGEFEINLYFISFLAFEVRLIRLCAWFETAKKLSYTALVSIRYNFLKYVCYDLFTLFFTFPVIK